MAGSLVNGLTVYIYVSLSIKFTARTDAIGRGTPRAVQPPHLKLAIVARTHLHQSLARALHVVVRGTSYNLLELRNVERPARKGDDSESGSFTSGHPP